MKQAAKWKVNCQYLAVSKAARTVWPNYHLYLGYADDRAHVKNITISTPKVLLRYPLPYCFSARRPVKSQEQLFRLGGRNVRCTVHELTDYYIFLRIEIQIIHDHSTYLVSGPIVNYSYLFKFNRWNPFSILYLIVFDTNKIHLFTIKHHKVFLY